MKKLPGIGEFFFDLEPAKIEINNVLYQYLL